MQLKYLLNIELLLYTNPNQPSNFRILFDSKYASSHSHRHMIVVIEDLFYFKATSKGNSIGHSTYIQHSIKIV